MVVMHETLIYAVYYAPRGRLRLYRLGRDIAERHLFPTDLLVGIIGAVSLVQRSPVPAEEK